MPPPPTTLGAGAWRRGQRHRLALVGLVAMLLVGCSSSGDITFGDRPSVGSLVGTAPDGQIVVRTDQVGGTVDRRLLGTNVPAWLLPDLVADPAFRTELEASGTTLLRFPGGSWSSDYDWLACEQRDASRCNWTWAMRPSDVADLLEETGLLGMWTASFNGTAQEAAAAVAFFNGDVSDTRSIGTDRNGRDWKTVGHWAQLRAAGGHPEPTPIRYWEVGNEVYGAKASAQGDCASWGWENVWTCDGSQYVAGDGDHDGYLAFHDAMVQVDPDIEVGAVGVGAKGEWSDWDDAVVGGAGDAIDFYIVHQYGSNGDEPAGKVLGLPADKWPEIMTDVRSAFADNGSAEAPVAITEHNLVTFIDGDDEKLMTTALNAFYLADTLGQMAENGVTIANQWNFANGQAPNGSDYGLVDAQTHRRSPAYYALALWARSGTDLVHVDLGDDLDDLVVYGTRAADGSARLLVLNPSSASVSATVSATPSTGRSRVLADEVVAESLDATQVTYNGSTDPDLELDDPGQSITTGDDGTFAREFPAHSMTLLSWGTRP